MNKETDVLIIGSGFAGAVAAARLVDAGFTVTMLERGPWRNTLPVRKSGIEDRSPLPAEGNLRIFLRNLRFGSGPKQITFNKRGLMEVHLDKSVKILASSSVGGGSQVWGGALSRPTDPHYWDKITDQLSEELLAPHFKKVRVELGAVLPKNAVNISNHTSHHWKDAPYLLPINETEQQELAMLLPEEFGGTPQPNRKATKMDSTDGTYGSLSGAKTTVDTAYLIPRLGERLSLHPLHEVISICRNGNGYTVSAKDHKQKALKKFKSKYVILATGMMNTIKLLCENEEAGNLNSMPNLGEGFGTNGDFVAEWEPGGKHVNSTKGLSCHGRLKINKQPGGVSLMLGGSEPFPYPWWVPKFLHKKEADLNKKYTVVAMSPDNAHGKVRFNQGRVNIDYSMDREPVYKELFKTFDLLAKLSGKPVVYNKSEVFTCHPLGGCRISESQADGVVSSVGEVHTNSGLFIIDASVFPAPTGGPPSLNVAAWSSYVATELIKRMQVK